MTDGEVFDVERNRRWLLLLAVAAVTLILGAASATGVMYYAGWRHTPEREFTVAVYMVPDASVEERSAVREALGGLPAVDGVRVEDEALRLTALGRDFDCSPIPVLRASAGVDRVRVTMRPLGRRVGAVLGC
ncbi:hypothetical protein KZ829_31190 [Actinoplanes hulinensis]|uniref:FtsX extracellular domain-containing protein n=1 Tax=Actinoplanes hulinensis TaxID=1144547 RepID=A0ABS7BD88_9ACTN|nr:hypothetical protein [Actinoplanes hulinensis]MBW6438203.1 hypothetical protein [Actinoplanes hulinensis]